VTDSVTAPSSSVTSTVVRAATFYAGLHEAFEAGSLHAQLIKTDRHVGEHIGAVLTGFGGARNALRTDGGDFGSADRAGRGVENRTGDLALILLCEQRRNRV
jgi:hypothetical protein